MEVLYGEMKEEPGALKKNPQRRQELGEAEFKLLKIPQAEFWGPTVPGISLQIVCKLRKLSWIPKSSCVMESLVCMELHDSLYGV